MLIIRKLIFGITVCSLLFLVLTNPIDSRQLEAIQALSNKGNLSSSSSLSSSSKSSSNASSSESAVKPFTLSSETMNLKIGESQALKTNLETRDLEGNTLLWFSSDGTIADVDQNGKVTAINGGNCKITAYLSDGRFAVCSVTVKSNDVQSITLSKTKVYLLTGQGITLSAEISPADATDKTLIWKSSNNAVATVDGSGHITAKSTGSCAVTAASSSGVSASCQVTVADPVAVSSVSLSETKVTMDTGTTHNLSASVAPSNATNKTLKWESSNTKVATVSSSGKITAVKPGTCNITASSNNYQVAICVVTVTLPAVQNGAVLVLESPPSKDGYYGDSLSVTGYALNASGIANVKVYLDTVSSSGYIGDAQIGIPRSDVASKYSSGYPNSANSGYTYNMDISKLAFSSTHTVYVVSTGNDGSQMQQSAQFLAGNVMYTSYSISLSAAVAQQAGNTPALWANGRWEYAKIQSGAKGFYYYNSSNTQVWAASDSEYDKIISALQYYINPGNFANDPLQKYQFLKLSYVDCVTAAQLNAVLKGSLSGKGEVFLAAAQKYNVNPVYLAGHSIEETSNGSSQLAGGVQVASTGTTNLYYNLFGIRATDADPVGTGAAYAASQGWSSVDAAIYGGAQWISGNYINSSYHQDTIYKMRWNPANPCAHQYATDVKWAYNQIVDIKTCFDYFTGVKLVFDIPRYAS